MDKFRYFVAYSKQVYEGERHPGGPLLYYLQPMTNRFWVWFNIRDWESAPLSTKVIHFLTGVSIAIYWISVGFDSTQEGVTWDNVVDFCKAFAFVVGGITTMTRYIQHWRLRKRMSTLLDKITSKVEISRRVCSPERMTESNNLFLLMSWATVITLFGGFLFSASILSFMVFTGERYVQLALPEAIADGATYGLIWWIECAYCVYIFLYSNLNFTTMDAMHLDSILQVGWLFRVEYDKLENLKPSDEDLNKKFGRVVEELVELKEITEEYVELIWWQQFMFWSVSYIALGLSAICLLLVMDSGVVEILAVLFYPTYILAIMAVWSTAGTHFAEKSSELNPSLFNSEWPDMHISYRKMFVILMSFGQDTPIMEIKPFYELSLFAFAQVLNKTYTLIAIVRNFLDEMQ